MTAVQIVVTVIGGVTIAVLARFFFRRRAATEAVERSGVQEVQVVVRGGYSPDVIRARTGLPLRIVFDRQEDGDRSSRVVFADLALSRFLAPFAHTTVEFTPTRPGSYGFACAAAMAASSLSVVTNANRLRRFHPPTADGRQPATEPLVSVAAVPAPDGIDPVCGMTVGVGEPASTRTTKVG